MQVGNAELHCFKYVFMFYKEHEYDCRLIIVVPRSQSIQCIYFISSIVECHPMPVGIIIQLYLSVISTLLISLANDFKIQICLKTQQMTNVTYKENVVLSLKPYLINMPQ